MGQAVLAYVIVLSLVLLIFMYRDKQKAINKNGVLLKKHFSS